MLVLLHGFTGHADAWDEIRALLPELESSAMTLFGHEPTAPPAGPIAFEDEVARVATRLRAHGAPVHLAGYSQGGRVALGVLVTAPELVASCVLFGAHPGLARDEDRRARAEADSVWTRLLREEGIEAFADRWQALPMWESQERLAPERLAAQRARRVRHDPRALAFAMESLGLAQMPAYGPSLPRVSVPLTLVVGELDAKFTALARQMLAAVPTGVGALEIVPGVGHNVPFESPERAAAILRASCARRSA